MALLAAFIAWPFVEIALFVVIGGEIGLLATLGIILATALLGGFLLRREAMRGQAVMQSLRAGRMELGGREAAGGFWRVIAALLLILPGFLTDALGLLLLLPPVQILVTGFAMRNMTIVAGTASTRRSPMDEGVIDGEWQDVTPDETRPTQGRITDAARSASGWRQDED